MTEEEKAIKILENKTTNYSLSSEELHYTNILYNLILNLQKENTQLKSQIKQRDDTINKVSNYIDKFIPIDEDTILMKIRQRDYIIELLNTDKGE